MSDSAIGKWNIGIGLGVMVLFMLYGFFLIYMRDFTPGREAWIARLNVSPHFEARLAHAHGNLFSLLNIVFGALLLWLPVRQRRARWISLLTLAGLLMPIGILSENLSQSTPHTGSGRGGFDYRGDGVVRTRTRTDGHRRFEIPVM